MVLPIVKHNFKAALQACYHERRDCQKEVLPASLANLKLFRGLACLVISFSLKCTKYVHRQSFTIRADFASISNALLSELNMVSISRPFPHTIFIVLKYKSALQPSGPLANNQAPWIPLLELWHGGYIGTNPSDT